MSHSFTGDGLQTLVRFANDPLRFLEPILEFWGAGFVDQRIQRHSPKLNLAQPCATVAEFAAFVRVHPETVRGWIKLPAEHPRHLTAIWTGNQWILDPPAVRDWMARNRAAALADAEAFIDGLAA